MSHLSVPGPTATPSCKEVFIPRGHTLSEKSFRRKSMDIRDNESSLPRERKMNFILITLGNGFAKGT